MSKIFQPILKSLASTKRDISEPISFLDYVNSHGIKTRGTATHISVQTFSDLDPFLKEQGWMVYRLGSRPNVKGTHFGLIRKNKTWEEHFFLDSISFTNVPSIELKPNWYSDQLLAFTSIPSLTETSYVNLALALQLFEKTLDLEIINQSIPATGRGNYSFNFTPNSQTPEKKWLHHLGQVEIDSVFIANYLGEKHIVVIEAKTSKKLNSLAKYKLSYPIEAIRKNQKLPILPIYLRVIESKGMIEFYIGVCKSIKYSEPVFIDSLQIESAKKICCLK